MPTGSGPTRPTLSSSTSVRDDKSWDARIWQRTESHAGRVIGVWGA